MSLSLAIPTSAQMATESTVDGSKVYSYPTQQAYRYPVSPLKHFAVHPQPSTSLTSPAAQVDPAVSVKDVAPADVRTIAKLLVSMKGTLDQAAKAFDFLAGDVKFDDDIQSASTELEGQTARQETELKETSTSEELVANEMEDCVDHEPTRQNLRNVKYKFDSELEAKAEHAAALEVDLQPDPDTPLISPQDNIRTPLKIPILLYEGASDDEDDFYEMYQRNSRPMLDTTALFPPTEYVHFSTGMQTALFDESCEHEPPPPSPAPVVGPFRFLLRPLPTPEQSPAYVVRDTLPSTVSSCSATPVTAYPRVPAPTPTTNEPTFMVLPIKSAPVSALTPNSEFSPLAPRDANLLFALSSEQNKELLRQHDLDGFVVPTPMAAWPKTRTIVKTPMSLCASPLMIPPPLEASYLDMPCCTGIPISVQESPAEDPVLVVPPPRAGPRAGNSFADNLRLLPPLVIT